jgi:hypothetical protein
MTVPFWDFEGKLRNNAVSWHRQFPEMGARQRKMHPAYSEPSQVYVRESYCYWVTTSKLRTVCELFLRL